MADRVSYCGAKSDKSSVHFVIIDSLQWLNLDGVWVVFSGATLTACELDAFTAATLGMTEAGHDSAAKAAQAIAEGTGCDADRRLYDAVEVALSHLVTNGLVEARRR